MSHGMRLRPHRLMICRRSPRSIGITTAQPIFSSAAALAAPLKRSPASPAMTPQQAVNWLVDYESIDPSSLKPFDESGIWDPGMDPFPPSRAEAVRIAREPGEGLGDQGACRKARRAGSSRSSTSSSTA